MPLSQTFWMSGAWGGLDSSWRILCAKTLNSARRSVHAKQKGGRQFVDVPEDDMTVSTSPSTATKFTQCPKDVPVKCFYWVQQNGLSEMWEGKPKNTEYNEANDLLQRIGAKKEYVGPVAVLRSRMTLADVAHQVKHTNREGRLTADEELALHKNLKAAKV